MSSELEIEENLITLTFDEDNLTETKKAKRIHVLLFISAAYATLTVFFILFFLFYSAGSFFAKHNILDFLFGDEWFPYAFTDAEETKYGAFNLIMGTLLVSFGAMVIAIPLGISTAVFIAEISPPKLARFMKGAVEILAGIPSIVYGYFGMFVLNKWI